MNNYGRNQMNNRTRQGNMQYNRMNRNNCGCDNAARPVDNCGCNNNARTTDNCGCNNNARTADNCGCNEPRRTADNCGCNNNARTTDNCGCNTPSGRVEPRRTTNDCGCDHEHHHHHHEHSTGTAGCNASRYDQLSGMALAMSYVPWQTFCKLYELEEARCQGTIFKQLDLDFLRGCRS